MLRSEWPNANHQDLHHKSMMPILPLGIPFSLDKVANIFFELLKCGDWLSAVKMVVEKQVSVTVSDQYRNNIFNYATSYVASSKSDSNQHQPLFFLVEEAIKSKLEIRMNYAFYMNPLHILARGEENNVTLKLLDYLLSKIDPIYLNAYNKFGKTPLLEAISKNNEKTALRLLEHAVIDVNLFKIHNISTFADAQKVGIIENYNIRHGCSVFEAATSLGMTKVAQRVQNHPRYNRNLKYVYPTSGDVIRIEHFLFAEQGNVDTLKVLFKNYDVEVLMDVDDLCWTMLNVACFAANLPVVEFLLDKDQLDKVIGFTIPENLYIEFVNRRDDLFNTALGRVLFGVGQDYNLKKEAQISLFIKCRHFRVNDALQCTGKALIHYIAENNLIQLMKELSERGDVNFDKENLLGQTALEIAAIAGHYEMVELLSNLASKKNIVINPNRYSRKCALVKRLSFYMEEQWFGPVSIEGLTVDDLIEIYRTKESHKIHITYLDFITSFEVIHVPGDIIKDIEPIKQHLAYYFSRTRNEIEMTLVDAPSWIDGNLYAQIEDCLMKKFNKSLPLKAEFNLNINGTRLKIIAKPLRRQHVTRVGTINYDLLCEHLGKQTREEREKMLFSDYMSLLATVIEQAQKVEDKLRKYNLIRVIQSLVKFPKIKLNILIKKNDKVCYIDEIIVMPEINKILESARLGGTTLASQTKKTNSLSDKLFKAKQTGSPLYKFAKAFVYNIERKNIERQFHSIYSEEEYRRMDALARIFEADGVCAAVYFDGNMIFYATNSANDGALDQHEIIKSTLNYFSNRINCSVSMDVLKKEKINLIRRMVEAKVLNGFKAQKRDIFKRKVFDPLVEKVIENIDLLGKLIFEEGLSLDKENVLTKHSFEKVLKLCGIEQYAELNKSDTGEQIISQDSFPKRINAIIKFFIRAMLDFKKIEDYMEKNKTSNFALALANKKYFLVGEYEAYHAEMKLLAHILGANFPYDKYYIGISKLCCAHCNLILSYFSENFKYSKFIKTRGAHGEDSRWPLPGFITTIDGFEKIFGSDQEFCQLFKDSYNSNRNDTLEFIKDYSVLKDRHELDFLYESLARRDRSQEHAWSDSDSDVVTGLESPLSTQSSRRNSFSTALLFSKYDFYATDMHDILYEHDLEEAIKASFNDVKKQDKIGPKSIVDWRLKDVEAKGNCFYLAVVDQFKLMHHPFMTQILRDPEPQDLLRLRIQENQFKDREWADYSEIIKFCRNFDSIVAIADTRAPEMGFHYYYINEKGMENNTKDWNNLPNKPIVRLAFTGNHFLSVRKYISFDLLERTVDYYITTLPKVTQGSYVGQLPRGFREIATEVHKIKTEKSYMPEGLANIINVASQIGKQHPILMIARRLQAFMQHCSWTRNQSQADTTSGGEIRRLTLSNSPPKILEERNIIASPELIDALERCKIEKDGRDLPTPELALRRASATGKIEIVRTLLKHVKDIDINQTGSSGKTALQFAKENNKKEVVEFLKNVGAKFEKTGSAALNSSNPASQPNTALQGLGGSSALQSSASASASFVPILTQFNKIKATPDVETQLKRHLETLKSLTLQSSVTGIGTDHKERIEAEILKLHQFKSTHQLQLKNQLSNGKTVKETIKAILTKQDPLYQRTKNLFRTGHGPIAAPTTSFGKEKVADVESKRTRGQKEKLDKICENDAIKQFDRQSRLRKHMVRLLDERLSQDDIDEQEYAFIATEIDRYLVDPKNYKSNDETNFSLINPIILAIIKEANEGVLEELRGTGLRRMA